MLARCSIFMNRGSEMKIYLPRVRERLSSIVGEDVAWLGLEKDGDRGAERSYRRSMRVLRGERDADSLGKAIVAGEERREMTDQVETRTEELFRVIAKNMQEGIQEAARKHNGEEVHLPVHSEQLRIDFPVTVRVKIMEDITPALADQGLSSEYLHLENQEVKRSTRDDVRARLRQSIREKKAERQGEEMGSPFSYAARQQSAEPCFTGAGERGGEIEMYLVVF